MIRIPQIALPVERLKAGCTYEKQVEEIKGAIQRKYRIPRQDITSVVIRKRSLDARKKGEIKYLYTVDASLQNEKKLTARFPELANAKEETYMPSFAAGVSLSERPVVIGFGPAGMFCALELARRGYQPIVLERGRDVDRRTRDVEAFWQGGGLNPDSNVQFGEGGAGTFSDGKLNTMVKDPLGRHRHILETFVEFGAPSDILYVNKPHIGTDYLRIIVKRLRQEIIRLGGEVRFESCVSGFAAENGKLTGVLVGNPKGNCRQIPCSTAVLALGHSARDTFFTLWKLGVSMEAKAFAVGFRMEHSQERINRAQYGESAKYLPAADYKVTWRAANGRSVYSFCMCPGGFVVNASSEPGRIAVNGMSNHDRNEKNANSAMIVSVEPKDFMQSGFMPGALADDLGSLESFKESSLEPAFTGPLAGVAFQRAWERAAFLEGQGKIPVQRFEDFCEGRSGKALGSVLPNIRGGYALSDLNRCLPPVLCGSLKEAIGGLGRRIRGFDDPDAVLSGVESRTSSPVRILRDDSFQSNIRGLYPCGEGAGYAGGITSAAMDGLKVFEAIAKKQEEK